MRCLYNAIGEHTDDFEAWDFSQSTLHSLRRTSHMQVSQHEVSGHVGDLLNLMVPWSGLFLGVVLGLLVLLLLLVEWLQALVC